MGKKGLSRDEKLQKVQELLHEARVAMTLKELEQRAYREKGVVANTVKDIVAELQADGLVCQDKIGLSNYFWSFPSQGLVVRRQKQADLETRIESKKRRRDELEEEEQGLHRQRGGDDDEVATTRAERLKVLKALQEEQARLDATLNELRANDPELLEALKDDIQQAKDAVERWMDNLSEAKKIYRELANQYDDNQFDEQFQTQGWEEEVEKEM